MSSSGALQSSAHEPEATAYAFPAGQRASTATGRQSVAHRIIERIEAHGVDRVFGIPGGAISPLNDALLDSKLEHVTCQHETMAVHVAAGYARATGRPGVVMVTSGPGVLNAMVGIASAFADESPVVVFGGEIATSSQGRGALQDGSKSGMDLLTVLAPVTKAVDALYQPGRAEAMVQQAFDVAMSAPRGPVFLQLPADLARQRLAAVGLPAWVQPPREPDAQTCGAIAELLARAVRPALLLGVGARAPGVAAAIRRLAERTRCPVITDIEGKGLFPESHPLSLGMFGVGSHGPAAAYLQHGVELLIAVGARFDDTTTCMYSPLLRPEQGKLAQLDHDPRRLCRAYVPDLAMCSDLCAAVERIHALLPVPTAAQIVARDQQIRALRRPAPAAAVLGRPPHDPRVVVRALQQAFGERAIFTTDIGNHLLFAAQHLRVDEPDGFFVSNGLGAMSSGVGTAIGLQLGHTLRTGRQVVAICGDGVMLMAGNELASCCRYDIPVVFAVFNDGQLGMVQHGLTRIYGRTLDLRTPRTDLVAYAGALGAEARRIVSMEDLAGVCPWKGPGPLVLDIPIDPGIMADNPREQTVGVRG